MPTPPKALSMKAARKTYGDVVALDALDLDIAPGECVALIGQNGSGKTTAVRLASGHLQPSSGRIEVSGLDVNDPDHGHGARAEVAFVPDNPVLYDDLTVEEHLELLALAHGSTDGLDDRVDDLIEELGLSERRGFLPGQLSRGMRQKVQLACAFIRPFSVLILDEPVVGLDPPSQTILKDILHVAKEQQGAILLATHQLAFARGLADRAVILSEGKIASDGPFERVMAGELASSLGLE